jgi:hypothetical protein
LGQELESRGVVPRRPGARCAGSSRKAPTILLFMATPANHQRATIPNALDASQNCRRGGDNLFIRSFNRLLRKDRPLLARSNRNLSCITRPLRSTNRARTKIQRRSDQVSQHRFTHIGSFSLGSERCEDAHWVRSVKSDLRRLSHAMTYRIHRPL